MIKNYSAWWAVTNSRPRYFPSCGFSRVIIITDLDLSRVVDLVMSYFCGFHGLRGFFHGLYEIPSKCLTNKMFAAPLFAVYLFMSRDKRDFWLFSVVFWEFQWHRIFSCRGS